MSTPSERRRSVAFLEHEDETWACFLVTHPGTGGRWQGYFSFRPGEGEAGEDEVRTAAIFLEDSEAEVHEKARGLGRPLLRGLLASALHKSQRDARSSPRLRRRFRELLSENARELSGGWAEDDQPVPSPQALAALRSLYSSYRLDQVCHLISLVAPEDFEDTVEQILDGQSIDFRASDQVQFAMMVVEHIEKLLPLPPFEIWVEDFRAHPETYRLYTHTLHREGKLP